VLRKVDGRFSGVLIDDELVLVDAETGQFFSLEGVGLEIWNSLDETGEIDAICARLESRFDVPPERCRADVERFAAVLVERGFAEHV
jgi:hypothetical protein